MIFQNRTAHPAPAAARKIARPPRQRRCACGGIVRADGECEQCRRKRLTQESAIHGGHNFAALRLRQAPAPNELVGVPSRSRNPLSANGPDEEGQKKSPPHPEQKQDAGGQGTQSKGQKSSASGCPTKTGVEKLIDTTPAGIQKGYLTGYGATAVMKVEPDATNWDGTQVVEALKETKNNCPQEFQIAPCSAHSTFPVGGEANSSVLGKLPALQNRFYDHHYTRWNKGSLLHDRNPKDIASCEVACEQNYSCGGKVIGTHTITRTFTKGTHNGRNVTLVAVKKT